jgi:anaerobic selenocysteine-containing dehydrogenase
MASNPARYCNLVIEQGTIDWEYLTKYTNASWLVKEDGHFLRAEPTEGEEQGEALAWSINSRRAIPVSTPWDVALEGSFTVEGEVVKPAFQVMKEHFSQYTADWAADVTGLEADQIRQVAHELGENAMIGSTMQVDGHTLPYTPISIMWAESSAISPGKSTRIGRNWTISPSPRPPISTSIRASSIPSTATTPRWWQK